MPCDHDRSLRALFDDRRRFAQRLFRFRQNVGFVEVEQYVGREVDTHLIADLFHLQILHSAADIDHGKKQIDDLRRLKVCALPAFLSSDQSDEQECKNHCAIGTSSIGWKCGISMVIFDTSGGGAGNLAHRFTRDPGCTSATSLLQTHLPSESRTTKYFFLLTGSTR